MCVCVADEVPGSAVLVFDIELVDMEEGLPEGYMFIWNDDVSPDLFTEMDVDNNKQVEPSEVCPDSVFIPLYIRNIFPFCSCPCVLN